MRMNFLLSIFLFFSSGVSGAQNLDFDGITKAANNGDSRLQLFLGLAYELGKDLPKDNNLALYWYQRAAEQGNADAQSILGYAYNEGKIVPKDSMKSAFWHQKAAVQGNSNSQAVVASYYWLGVGVPKSPVLSYAWANLAASSGNADALQFRGMIEEIMSSAQIIEAQKLSSEWSPGKSIQK